MNLSACLLESSVATCQEGKYIRFLFFFPPKFFFLSQNTSENGIFRGKWVIQKNITEDLERVKDQRIVAYFSPLQYEWSLNLEGRETFIWRQDQNWHLERTGLGFIIEKWVSVTKMRIFMSHKNLGSQEVSTIISLINAEWRLRQRLEKSCIEYTQQGVGCSICLL